MRQYKLEDCKFEWEQKPYDFANIPLPLWRFDHLVFMVCHDFTLRYSTEVCHGTPEILKIVSCHILYQ